MNPPLSGVRVLDLSTIVAGPAAGMVLAGFGADVIKVETVHGGEDSRRMGPHRGAWGAYFVALNCGKRSLALDITKPAGRDVVLRLAAGCDVFLENFRGGKAAALGLDEQAVRARKPDIIYASISAYGPGGPDYTKPGYDAVLQARTGIMSVTGTGDEAPLRTGVSILDMGTGAWTALGVLMALYERERSGRGQRVDASLFQTGITFMAYHLLYRQFAGVDPRPQGSRHTAFAPYGAFPTADGAIMIGISGDRAFHRLCAALENSQWVNDPRFRTKPDRVRHVAELETLIGAVLKTAPTSHWTALLDKHGVANDPVQSAAQVLGDAQLAALGQLTEVPLGGAEPALVPQLPVALSPASAAAMGPPPAVGEHSRAILREAGYGDAEIDELVRTGICQAND
jgi:crotonobetainyl-CoA:carnitine CoA-transferase CaiB-like acyl-CoA transferase